MYSFNDHVLSILAKLRVNDTLYVGLHDFALHLIPNHVSLHFVQVLVLWIVKKSFAAFETRAIQQRILALHILHIDPHLLTKGVRAECVRFVS